VTRTGTTQTVHVMEPTQTTSTVTTTVTSTTAVTPPGEEAPSINEVQEFASKVNLRASDLPGFQPIRGLLADERTVEYGPLSPGTEKCDGGPILMGGRGGFVSPLFRKRNRATVVVSGVYSLPDPSLASAYIAAAGSSRGRSCFRLADRDI